MRYGFVATAAAFAAAALGLLLFACPPADSKSDNKAAPAAPASSACTKIGASCEYSPGKLGTCVQKDECPAASAPCFICQSQH